MPSVHHIHFVFALIWIVAAFAFFFAASDSYETMSISLPQATASLDDSVQRRINFNGQDVSAVMDNVIDAHNQEVSKLEISLHQSARLTFYLNLLSGIMSVLGFFNQIAAYFLETRKKHSTLKA